MSEKKEQPMRKISIEKIVLSVGATGEDLERGYKLIEMLTKKKPARMKTKKRIPTLGIRPGLEIGVVSTIRKNTDEFLKRLLSAIDNKLKKKQISTNNFSFGIKEYIEIPGTEYNRDVGIMGLDVTVVFKRSGRRVGLRKVKRGKVPERHKIQPEEIIKYMTERFGTKFT